MSAQETGSKLVELFNKSDFETIYGTLYSPEIESIESDGQIAKGFEGIQKKNEWWESTMEVHSGEAVGPFVHGDGFAVIFRMDVTEKATGNRFQMEEIGVYDLADGKVVRERFFYNS